MQYFKNKKILVTGGAGFIGSHLTKKLVEANAKVSVVVKYNSIIECPRLLSIWHKVRIIEADLRNIDSIIALGTSSLKKKKLDRLFLSLITEIASFRTLQRSSELINSYSFLEGTGNPYYAVF